MLVSSLERVPSVSAVVASSSIPVTLQATLIVFAFRSSSLINDELNYWSIDAKLKMLSVTVEQPTEGRLQDGQSMLDLGMVACNVV